MPTINLCCPYAERHSAHVAGAIWSPTTKAWTIDQAKLDNPATYAALARFLPTRYRADSSSPWLTPNLVPEPLWGRNLRALLRKAEWDRIRKSVYEACGKRCTICGSAGRRWPVEADEVWHYDDATNTQTLVSVTGLCPACHEVRHWGHALKEGHRDRALAHLAAVNRWSMIEATRVAEDALIQWYSRSRRRWRSDYSHAISTYNITISKSGLVRADAANTRLIAESRARPKRSA